MKKIQDSRKKSEKKRQKPLTRLQNISILYGVNGNGLKHETLGNTMNYTEINELFTKEIHNFIATGWVVNSQTMNGNQTNEITKVDFTKDGRIFRVVLERGREFIDGRSGIDYVALKVGEYAGLGRTIWNNELSLSSERRFYKFDSSEWFTTDVNAVLEARKLHWKRVNAADLDDGKIVLGEKYKAIALKWVKRNVNGCKTAKIDKIQEVYRIEGRYFIRLSNKGIVEIPVKA